MSSKGRKKQEENPQEYHPTPDWSVDTLIISPLLKLPGGLWIEPCAGTGNIIRAVNRLRDDVNWIALEINPEFYPPLESVIRPGRDLLLPPGDFLTHTWDLIRQAEVLIMNPPFSLAMPFIERAFGLAQWIACLQRTNFFGSKKRAKWMQTYCPDLYALPKRPSFREDNATDSIEYSWFCWPPDPFGNVGQDFRRRRSGLVAMLELPEGVQ